MSIARRPIQPRPRLRSTTSVYQARVLLAPPLTSDLFLTFACRSFGASPLDLPFKWHPTRLLSKSQQLSAFWTLHSSSCGFSFSVAVHTLQIVDLEVPNRFVHEFPFS